MLSRAGIAFVAAMLAASTAAAKENATHLPPYLTGTAAPQALDYLSAPPDPDSIEGKADRAVFEVTRALDGTPRWTQAQSDADLSNPGVDHAFSCALGTTIDATTTPALVRLLGRVESQALEATVDIKNKYRRVRPFVGNNLPICTPMRESKLGPTGEGGAESGGGPSYPSGHSTVGWATAIVLAELAPQHTDALVRRGRSYGESRIVCGVHFVTDIEAGRVVGSAVAAALQADPGFASDLAAARVELAAAAKAVAPDPAACSAEAALTEKTPY